MDTKNQEKAESAEKDDEGLESKGKVKRNLPHYTWKEVYRRNGCRIPYEK